MRRDSRRLRQGVGDNRRGGNPCRGGCSYQSDDVKVNGVQSHARRKRGIVLDAVPVRPPNVVRVACLTSPDPTEEPPPAGWGSNGSKFLEAYYS